MALIILLLLFISPTKSKFFFSTSDYQISATKSISDLYNGVANIKEISINLATQQHKFPIKGGTEKYLTDRFQITNTSAKEGVKDMLEIVDGYFIQIHFYSNSCTNSLDDKANQIESLLETSLELEQTDDYHLEYTKKGIDILGNILSELTGVPSPSEWRAHQKIMNDLIAVEKGEKKEIAKLETTVIHEKEIIDKILPIITKLTDDHC